MASLLATHCPTPELRSLRAAWSRDGLVIARGFLEDYTLQLLQRDAEGIVDSYSTIVGLYLLLLLLRRLSEASTKGLD